MLPLKKCSEKKSYAVQFNPIINWWFHLPLPVRGWTEKASWGSITYTWNSKSMGQLHLRGIACGALETGRKTEMRSSVFFFCFNTNGWKRAWPLVWKNPNRQASPRANRESRHSPLKIPTHTHTARHMHTPLSEWYGWEVDARRDAQVIDDRVSMNWN